MAKARKPKKPDYLKQVLAALEAGDTAAARAVLSGLHPADISHVLEGLTPELRATVWGQVDIQRMGEVLLELPEEVRIDLVKQMDGQALVAAARVLDTDDIADLIPDLSDEVIAEILFALDLQDRQRLNAVLSYPKDTAGGLMNVDTVTVRENITLEVVLRYLRRRGELPEHTNQLFVVDRSDRVVGALPVSRLLITETRVRVSQVMERDIVKFTVLTPDKEIAEAFERYNLVSAPVVDENNRLLGRITIDDVVDVIRDLADRQVMAPAGLSEDEDIFAPVVRTSRKRAIWLGVNLVTAFIAASVVGLFEQTIAQVAILAVMMPIVAGMGGNAGTQSLTLMVRGLALGELEMRRATTVVAKQALVGLWSGLGTGVILAAVAWLWDRNAVLAGILLFAQTVNLTVAGFFGAAVPLLLRRLRQDPALGSSILVTAATDSCGFFAFLGTATLLIDRLQ